MGKLIAKILIVLSLLFVNSFWAQEFTGRAEYQTKTVLKKFKMKVNGLDASDTEMKKIEEKINKMNEKTFVLDFNSFESIYYEPQKLEAPSANSGIRMITSGNSENVYKNIKTKIILSEKDFLNKEFLITDSLPQWQWQQDGTTKKIGDYICYKAVHIKKATAADWAEYEASKNKKETDKTNFFVMQEPKDKITTVWYTPDIPISQGPLDFWGLPGLILEVSHGDTTILCSKVIINPKEKITIKMPNKGKKVTQKEFDKIMDEKISQMKSTDGGLKFEINRN